MDGRGEVLARMDRDDGEGVIAADVIPGVALGEREPIPEAFWIAEYPPSLYAEWERQLELGSDYYLANTLPHLRSRFPEAAAG